MRVAEMNQGARQGHLQLVSEAHVLLRTWLHRLTWLQVSKLFIFILVQMFFLGGRGGLEQEVPDSDAKGRLQNHFKIMYRITSKTNKNWIFFIMWMRSSREWMRSRRGVRASDCQSQSRTSPGFDPMILWHTGIGGAADEAVVNKLHKKLKKTPVNFLMILDILNHELNEEKDWNTDFIWYSPAYH